ncbi:Gfo/Idh/MocA family oxidoreductase [Enterococcus hulanensis]|uniref:Gfo/Idh/MocA family oxidoreductase n=1 Tax=Enterococcus hulanensis TaxID=2559929 RepID=UPI00288DB97F|nr:Gfo/Idh/MocA family oxidoreductase [Enterococcus hulanensis]MDT2660865.1 Gfo/Idh/MocA family oxidoreductase [Enterococcus hulanensis]
MKVLFIGLGSIGRRHLSNLIKYCEKKGINLDITAYRTTSEKLDMFPNVTVVSDYSALSEDFDIAFITNPTFKHEESLKNIMDKVKYIFLEKPAFESSKDISNFEIDYDRIYIACPLRYKKVFGKVKQIIKDVRPISSRIVCSTFLPDWREGDYTKNYSAKKSMGGGVELDCIHELDYMSYLFGFPKSRKAYFGKKSDLDIDSNDMVDYLFEYEQQIVEVHLDYFGRFPERTLTLLFNQEKIEINLLNNTVYFHSTNDTIRYTESSNEMYEKELAYFIEKVTTGVENWNNLEWANKVLEIAEEIK